MESGSPRDLLNLKSALSKLPPISQLLATFQCRLIKELLQGWDNLDDISRHIDEAISPDAPLSTKDGGIIRDSYHDQVDGFRRITTDGSRWISDLEQKENGETGIDSLKIKYNQVFGE